MLWVLLLLSEPKRVPADCASDIKACRACVPVARSHFLFTTASKRLAGSQMTAPLLLWEFNEKSIERNMMPAGPLTGLKQR